MPRNIARSAALSLLLPAAGLTTAQAELPPLIPREVLFSGWDRGALQLSPDGTRLSWTAADGDLPPNIWVETLEGGEARRVTSNNRQGIFDYGWAEDGRHLLFFQDADGDENWHLFSVNLETGAVRDLTPFPGVRAQDLLTSPHDPLHVMVALNRRDPRVNDIYRVNIATGEVTLAAENPGDVISWTADDKFVIRACTAFTGEDARTIVRVRDSAESPWRDLMVVPFLDSPFYGQVNGGTLVAGFAPGGASLYVVDPLAGDRTRLVEMSISDGKVIREIASHPRSDVEYDVGFRLMHPMVLTDPVTDRVQAVGFNYDRLEWTVTDPAIEPDMAALRKAHGGSLFFLNRVRGDSLWLVLGTEPHRPDAWFLYDRTRREAKKLLFEEPRLAKYELAPMEHVVVRSRDSLDIFCYLTLPQGIEPKNLPLIMIPHGGPWWRDRWAFDPWVQALANRGYAVIQPQYRGSTGFGKAFFNAGTRQFGNRAIMRDFLDVVDWAVKSGLADKERIAVMGGSGGGYAALCCIVFQPDVWRCAVNVVGPSSVRTLLQSIPEYWKPVKRRWVLRFGDAENDDDYERSVSPVHHAKNIKAPLLMAYGLNDPRVHIREAEQMAAAMRAQELPLQFVVYPDEGHVFQRIENNLDFFGRVEEFLAEHLGGRKEPWRAIEGSSVEVR